MNTLKACEALLDWANNNRSVTLSGKLLEAVTLAREAQASPAQPTQPAAHTPTPWDYRYKSASRARAQAIEEGQDHDGGGASGFIFSGKGLHSVTIAFLPHHRDPKEDAMREANAALIVRAVNSHEELVAALEWISTHSAERDTLRKARTALASAKGQS